MTKLKYKKNSSKRQTGKAKNMQRKTITNVRFVFQHFIWHLNAMKQNKRTCFSAVVGVFRHSLGFFDCVLCCSCVTCVNYGDDVWFDALHTFIQDFSRIETSFVTSG